MLCKLETGNSKGLLENKVNIISAFPGTGKSTATMLLAGDRNYLIRDIDSAEFRANLKKKAGPIDSDTNWFIYYVDYVQSMAKFYEQELKMNPEYEGKTVILFVASHEQVRSTMTAREMLYYYAVPTLNMFRRFILPAAAARIDAAKAEGDEDKVGSTTRAYEFLAKQGETMIGRVTDETAGNAFEQLIWLGSDTENDDDPAYLYYFIHRYTYIGDNLTNISNEAAFCVRSAIFDVILSMIRFNPGTLDAIITPHGEMAIITQKINLECLAEIFEHAGIDFTTAANFASYNSNHLVVPRDDAKDIYEILEGIVYESGESDYDLWGDKCRAFECLYDNMKGVIYKILLATRELVDAQVSGGDYSGVYDHDKDDTDDTCCCECCGDCESMPGCKCVKDDEDDSED